MTFLDKTSRFLNKILIWIAGFFLMSMVLLTCSNIVLRATWMPIQGTVELMGFFGAIVTAFALGQTQAKRGHIAVDVLVKTFPSGIRKGIRAINNILCMGFFGIATWQIVKKALILMRTGEVTETLKIAYYPFTLAVAFGCAVVTLVFLTDLLKGIEIK